MAFLIDTKGQNYEYLHQDYTYVTCPNCILRSLNTGILESCDACVTPKNGVVGPKTGADNNHIMSFDPPRLDFNDRM